MAPGFPSRAVASHRGGETVRHRHRVGADAEPVAAPLFRRKQVFRIDHYLGKETVQNLLVFRFANTLIEPLWNRNYIDHVQITVAEDVGIEKRADYYDKAGAMRDMLQNHLMQLLTLVGMEPPPALEADALRDEKVKVLRSIRPISKRSVHAHAFRAQYKAGRWPASRCRATRMRPGSSRIR
jgi:glucose-6-phosphate 1-dehydrogenase